MLDVRGKRAGEVMPVSRKSVLKSSHDMILIVGAVIAVAWMISSMAHHWRMSPTNLGMTDTVTVASIHIAPH